MFALKSQKPNLKQELYRKAIHLSSLWMPLFIYLAPKAWSLILFGAAFVLNVIIEYANYRRQSWARKTFGRLFFRTLRAKETIRNHFRPSGSMYVLSAAFLCALCFSKPIAAISMTVMLISDSAAALIGKRFGSHKIYKQKSAEGTAAFFISALLVNLALNPLFPIGFSAVIACLAATLAELFEDKIKTDDNLSIPLICGILLTVL